MTAAIACSDEEGIGPVAEAELAATAARLYCDNIVDCCSSGGLPYNRDTCLSTAEAAFAASFPRFTPGRVRYDEAAAGRCLDAFAGVVRDCLVDDADGEDCENVWVGTVAEGGACSSNLECAQPPSGYARCQSEGGGNPGVCVTENDEPGEGFIRGRLGDPCSFTCSEEDGGEIGCFSSAVPNTQDSPGGNATCVIDEGLYCSTAQRTCQPIPERGQPCEFLCATGSFCHPATAICEPQQQTGSCLGRDDACVPATSWCDFSIDECRPRQADGAPCEGDGECENFCRGGRCTSVTVNAEQCAGVFDD